MKKVFQKIIKYDTEAHAAKQRYYYFFSFQHFSPFSFLCLVHAISTDNDTKLMSHLSLHQSYHFHYVVTSKIDKITQWVIELVHVVHLYYDT